MWNLGQLIKKNYFVNNYLIKVRILKSFSTYVKHNCDYLPHTIFRFYLIDFHLNKDFPSQLYVFLP